MVDDCSLIRKIANNDMIALELLFKKYRNDVYRYAYMVTKNVEISEDISQDVFLKVVKCALQYQKYISVKAWIIQITRTTALDILKHNAFSKSNLDEMCDVENLDNNYTNFDFLEIIKNLKFIEQEIIILHIIYGLRHVEIAKILFKTSEAIRQQYTRSLSSLKKYYY